ncbi:hypothetical protein TNCV_4186421 [Trichonephila clavipes]|nr:hypothetical protein TNCV_4186421 [Trichonephila clavipes]
MKAHLAIEHTEDVPLVQLPGIWLAKRASIPYPSATVGLKKPARMQISHSCGENKSGRTDHCAPEHVIRARRSASHSSIEVCNHHISREVECPRCIFCLTSTLPGFKSFGFLLLGPPEIDCAECARGYSGGSHITDLRHFS